MRKLILKRIHNRTPEMAQAAEVRDRAAFGDGYELYAQRSFYVKLPDPRPDGINVLAYFLKSLAAYNEDLSVVDYVTFGPWSVIVFYSIKDAAKYRMFAGNCEPQPLTFSEAQIPHRLAMRLHERTHYQVEILHVGDKSLPIKRLDQPPSNPKHHPHLQR